MSWIQLNVSVANGSDVVTVNNNLSTAKVRVGDALILAGFQPVEIVGVYANSLTIASNWENSAQNGAMAAVMPTFGDFDNAAATMRQFTQTTQGNFAAMEAWWTQQSGSVTFKGQDGAEHQVRSAKQMDQDVQEKTDAVQAVTDEMVSLVGAQVALTQPDVYIPFNDSLQIVRGYGTHDKIDVSSAQDGSVMVELPTKSVEFSRASGRQVINKNGVYKSLEIDKPGISSKGIGIFKNFTNSLIRSQDQESAYTISNVTLTPDADTPLDSDSYLVAETTGDTSHYVQSRVVVTDLPAGEKISGVWHIKVDQEQWYGKSNEFFSFFIYNWDNTIDNSKVNIAFDEQGEPIVTSGEGFNITPLNNGWYRVNISHELQSPSTQIRLRLLMVRNGSTLYTGDPSRYMKTVGWQVVIGSSCTLLPYVKTEDNPVTTSSDVVTFPVEGNLPVTGQSWCFACETDLAQDLGDSNRTVLSVGNASTIGNFIGLVATASNSFVFRSGGNASGDTNLGSIFNNPAYIPNGVNTLSVQYNADSYTACLYVNGVKNSIGDVYVGKITMPFDGVLRIGASSGTWHLNSHIKNIKFFFRLLSEAEHKSLGGAQ
ncbi:hypothetical protein [Vibrio sp. H11]|uniref:phage head spike fiber domain-containing protein n=1 Tax=Vibrio sp. H11 TaxID=2565928 RepID=UPI0010A5C1CC|nr:hypothetical protein [Vibrio sp. H11]